MTRPRGQVVGCSGFPSSSTVTSPAPQVQLRSCIGVIRLPPSLPFAALLAALRGELAAPISAAACRRVSALPVCSAAPGLSTGGGVCVSLFIDLL